MSLRMMLRVWEHELDSYEQAVLLAMADHADDSGYGVYPSVALVAWKTGIDRRTVQRRIKKLIEQKVLVMVAPATRYRPNEYRMNLDAAPKKPPFEYEVRFELVTPEVLTQGRLVDAPEDENRGGTGARRGGTGVGQGRHWCSSGAAGGRPNQKQQQQQTQKQNLPSQTGVCSDSEQPDLRHTPMIEAIEQRYGKHNDGLAMPCSGLFIKRLAELLRRTKSWPLSALLQSLDNAFASEDFLVSEAPENWIMNLPRYKAGVLDKFHKLKQGAHHDSKAEQRNVRNAENIRRAAERLRNAGAGVGTPDVELAKGVEREGDNPIPDGTEQAVGEVIEAGGGKDNR